MPTREGDRAPDFTAVDHQGNPWSLSDHRGKAVIVLYFYPKDDTPGCTAEARGFRDVFEEFQKAGAMVVGVSADTVESHRTFADRHQLPFVLLSDPTGEIRRLYKVPKSFGLIPGRVTFVIDKQGIVRNVFISQLRTGRHVQNALTIVKSLAS